MKRGETEREAIRISADASAKLLVSLRQQKEKLENRIASLQAVVDAWNSISGKRKVETGSADGLAGTRKRVKKGQVSAHIDQVLSDGGEYEEPELRKALADRFNEHYGRATVYTNLRRGEKDHKYVHKGKKWSLNPMKSLRAV